MPVLKEISNQFRVCVALMNDPHIMRHQPAVVADHFAAAMCKIEQLRRFLRKPDKAHDHWVDESILDVGVKKMVTAVLNKHMEPLRTNTFPEVFARDLGQWTDGEKHDGENLTEREIKESNCMGAIVLLYYYLSWHVMLILLNGKAYPCWKRSALWESELDFETFFHEMPTEDDMLELHYMKHLTIPSAAANDCIDYLPDFVMIDEPYSSLVKNKKEELKSRKTILINAYKSVLFEGRGSPADDGWSRIHTSLDKSDFNFEDLSRVITSAVLQTRLTLFGNVLTTYDQQDDIQKWRDMYTDIEIQSEDFSPEDNDDDDDGKFRSNTKVYRQRLARILKSQPYAVTPESFKENAKQAAIFDYCSAALMMDVSRAYLKLMLLIKELIGSDSDVQRIETSFLQFILNVHTKNSNIAALEEASESANNGLGTFKKFIKHMINQRKSITTYGIHPNAVMVDGLAGYYWGSRPCVGEGVNHMYLAWPDITNPDLNVLKAVQALCVEQSKIPKGKFTFLHIQPAVRNSLFVSTSIISLKKLLDAVKCHPALPNADRKIVLSTSPYVNDTNAFNYRTLKDSKDQWPTNNHDEEPAMNQSKALKLLNQEASELEKRIAEASGFRKYPGVSWPVKFDPNGKNFACFEFVRPVPKIVPSLTDSAYGVRVVMEQFRNAAKHGGMPMVSFSGSRVDPGNSEAPAEGRGLGSK